MPIEELEIFETAEWEEFLDEALAEFGVRASRNLPEGSLDAIKEVFVQECKAGNMGASFRAALDRQAEPSSMEGMDPEPESATVTPVEPTGNLSDLTKTQSGRFDNIFDRVSKKVLQTFGGTKESHAIHDRDDTELPGQAVQRMVVHSRGVTYTFTLQAERDE